MLRIEHFSKTYGGGKGAGAREKKAVDDLSLRIAPGEICAFIGHNGAGKTTTIKAAAGILPFDEGEIYVAGKSVRAEPLECKRRLAYLPDNPDLYEFLTGAKYLAFVADVFRIGAEERRERIRRYTELFEIQDSLGQSVAAYSHGMKQKLALVAALIHDPELLIMDEPFVGLDPKAARAVKDLMHGICSRGGAIFFSTHILEVAEKLCDKVAIIKNGRLVAAGGMEEVRGDASLEAVFFELEEGAKDD